MLRRCDEQKFDALQQKMCVLLEERQQLHAERRNAAAARSKLEALCRDLQAHYNVLRVCTEEQCRLPLSVNLTPPSDLLLPGGDPAALQGGRGEEDRDHHPLPEHADGDPDPD